MGDRFRVGVGGGGALRGDDKVLQRLGRLACPLIVVRQRSRELGKLIGKQRLDGLRRDTVQFLTPRDEQAVVGDVVRDGVLEDELKLGAPAHEVAALEFGEMGREVVARSFSLDEPAQHRLLEHAADDGCRLKRVLVRGGQAVDAGGDHALQRVRDVEVVERLGSDDLVAFDEKESGVDEGAQQFLQKEGVSLGP